MRAWNQLADDQTITNAIAALRRNGINAVVVGNRADAKRQLLELIPSGAEVMNMTSTTLEETGIAKEL